MPDREKTTLGIREMIMRDTWRDIDTDRPRFQRVLNDAITMLKEQELVRCKDCKYRGDSEKCVLSAISKEKNFPLFMLDNRGEWFCADGEAKE